MVAGCVTKISFFLTENVVVLCKRFQNALFVAKKHSEENSKSSIGAIRLRVYSTGSGHRAAKGLRVSAYFGFVARLEFCV
jgi:hypothetical protein